MATYSPEIRITAALAAVLPKLSPGPIAYDEESIGQWAMDAYRAKIIDAEEYRTVMKASRSDLLLFYPPF